MDCHQGHNMGFTGRLLINSWCKAFKLDELVFAGAAGSAPELMLGKPMMAQRAAMMGKQGVSYCIALPVGKQAGGGVKVAAIFAEAAGKQLQAQEGGPDVRMVPAE